MEALLLYLPTLGLLLFTVGAVVWDPRRLWCVLLCGGVVALGFAAAMTLLADWTTRFSPDAPGWVILIQYSLMLLTVVVAALLLIHSGIVLLRKEGRSLSHGLALALGVAIVGYVALVFLSLWFSQLQVFSLLLFMGFPLFYLSFFLVSFLVYAAVYAKWARWWAKRAHTVVVLGAGLQGDQLTPLLKARMDRGIAAQRRAEERAQGDVRLVLSGGQGPDETVSEAAAMARYAAEQGVENLVMEDRSTTTEENLRFTKAILGAEVPKHQDAQPWLAVTSDYHAFRAALLMKKLGIKGQAIGARTPRYFWSSAVLREYAAILLAHRKANAVLIGLLSLPFLLALGLAVFQAFN